MFLNVLVNDPNDIAGRWQMTAYSVQDKTAGRAVYSRHPDDDDKEDDCVVSCDSKLTRGQMDFGVGKGSKRVEKARKKGTLWTVEEHRRFLAGLEVYGKGDWISISRMMVVTRTSTQVASHAQKYFLRQKAGNKGKKRSSIHDITTADDSIEVQAQPTPSTAPIPPATGFSGSVRGRGAPAPPKSSAPGFNDGIFFGGQGRGADSSLKPASINFHAGDGVTLSPQASSLPDFYGGQFFGGQGRGTPLPITPAPTSFYASDGPLSLPELQHTNFYVEDGGGAWSPSSLLPTSFYFEEGAPPPSTGNEFEDKFFYYPF